MRMLVEFDDVADVWRFRRRELIDGAPVAAVLHGVAWTVATGDPTQPVEVEISASPSAFTRAATAILLGQEAAGVLDQDPPAPTADGTTLVGEVELDDDGLLRRGAMGLLALALTVPDDQPLRALDTAALLRRAHLDGLPITIGDRVEVAALPTAEDLADDADEALDLLPDAVRQALESPADRDPAAWSAARAAVSDAGAYVAATTGDLLADQDATSEFESIARRWDGGVGVGLGDQDRGPTWLGDETGVPDEEPQPVRALLADPLIRGVVSLQAQAAGGTLEVALRFRPGYEPLHVRVIGPGARELAGGPLEAATDQPLVVAASFAVEASLVERVEVVRDLDAPVPSLDGAVAADRSAWVGEAERVLAQVVLLDQGPDGDGERRRAAQGLVDELAASLAELGLHPRTLAATAALARPSDAIRAVLANSAEVVLRDLRAVVDPAERAMRADSTASLLDGCVLPWGQALLAEIRMIEAGARVAGGYGTPAQAADLAAAAYAAAGDDDGHRQARDLAAQLREGRP